MSRSKESGDMECELAAMSIEALFEKAQEITRSLEQPDIPLEQSFTEYETGVTVLKTLAEKLKQVEANVQKITADGVLEDFLAEEE